MGQLKDIHHEVTVMKGLCHPGIISLQASFEGKEHVIIVMNRVAGGTLFDRIIKCKNYTEEMAAGAVNNLLEALRYLHATGIAHRDIKPENLLLRNVYKDGREEEMTDVVLADFGLASHAPMNATCGSPCYVAPEVIIAGFGEQYHRKSEPYGPRCDVWSLGVVLYVMLSGRFPFSAPGNSRNALFNLIISAELRFHGQVWDGVSDDAKDFIRKLLTKDPHARPSAADALQHRWITGVELSAPLQRNASLAQSVQELKAFTMRKHVNTAMSMYRVAGRLFKAGTGGLNLDHVPAFLKYVKLDAKNPFEHRIPVQSQSRADLIYTVDLEKIGRGLTSGGSATVNKAHALNAVCSCPSVRVCRHIQYVYQYLFMGETDQVPPHMADCEERRTDLVDKLAQSDINVCHSLPLAGAASALTWSFTATDIPWVRAASAAVLAGTAWRLQNTHARSKALHEELQRAEDFLLLAWKFKHAFDLTPETERKSVLTGSMLPGAVDAFAAAGKLRSKGGTDSPRLGSPH
eukprot:TRINITY_DN20565_c0_g1_i1.p1 TRINITY_DN20565_c0_g1~~TRINITY_DN20565_c0_g1_i1.p1  ORF type:complete len:595 (+),score=224.00 TRINITY_DN20565_c0_g1_i1:230-1786(+)